MGEHPIFSVIALIICFSGLADIARGLRGRK
jgi:hypothetical protein